MKVAGKAEGCYDLDNANVLGFSGSFATGSGLVAHNSDCEAWFSGITPATVSLDGPSLLMRATWKPAAGQAFTPRTGRGAVTNVTSPNQLQLAYHGVDVTDLDGFYRQGQLSGPASGAFSPPAAELKLQHIVQQDIGVIFDRCSSNSGLRCAHNRHRPALFRLLTLARATGQTVTPKRAVSRALPRSARDTARTFGARLVSREGPSATGTLGAGRPCSAASRTSAVRNSESGTPCRSPPNRLASDTSGPTTFHTCSQADRGGRCPVIIGAVARSNASRSAPVVRKNCRTSSGDTGASRGLVVAVVD